MKHIYIRFAHSVLPRMFNNEQVPCAYSFEDRGLQLRMRQGGSLDAHDHDDTVRLMTHS